MVGSRVGVETMYGVGIGSLEDSNTGDRDRLGLGVEVLVTIGVI